MNFLETYDELYKLYEANKVRFNKANLAVSKDSVFKFLSTVSDLNSALQSRLLWSNIRTDGLQFDEYCAALDKRASSKSKNIKWGFISLTAEPTKVALELRRPFGIELDLKPLIAGVKAKGYKYRAFNQTDSMKAGIIKGKTINQYIKLNGVGRRKDGSYWMVLQGQYEPRDISKKTYIKLLDWLKKNSGEDQLVHFVFDDRDPLATSKTTKYQYTVRDFFDATGSTVKETPTTKNGKSYMGLSNGNFRLDVGGGIGFNSIIREMSEMWVTGLNRAIGTNAIDGTTYDNHLYNNKVKPLFLNTVTDVDYALDKDTSNELLRVLDEFEYRIYLPTTEVFRFDSTWVKSVRLPDWYGIRWAGSKVDRDINLEAAFKAFSETTDKSDEALTAICDKLKIRVELETAEIIRLYRLLDTKGLLTKCSFYQYATPESRSDKVPSYKANDMKNPLDDAPDSNGVYGTDHRTRFLMPKTALDPVFGLQLGTKDNANDEEYRLIKLVDENGYPSIIWRDFIAKDGKPRNARLEVRGAILGKDEDGNWYINVVSKKSKRDDFDELPGGSFSDAPKSTNDLYPIAAAKFKDETGVNIKPEELILLNDITYAYEDVKGYMKELTADTNLLYDITVDWTFIAVLKDIIDPTRKKQNNDGQSKWLLLDHALVSNDNFMKRYRNLVPFLKQYIN